MESYLDIVVRCLKRNKTQFTILDKIPVIKNNYGRFISYGRNDFLTAILQISDKIKSVYLLYSASKKQNKKQLTRYRKIREDAFEHFDNTVGFEEGGIGFAAFVPSVT